MVVVFTRQLDPLLVLCRTELALRETCTLTTQMLLHQLPSDLVFATLGAPESGMTAVCGDVVREVPS